MTGGRFGRAGERLVIEECLQGPEVSYFVLSDGSRALPLGTAQDHKRIHDDDLGPNTGGMGAFAPSPLVDLDLHARVMREIVDPVISGMAAEGNPFKGFLYVGLMLTATGPRVIEFNVRLGDPEAQVILPRIAEPLTPLLVAAARGSLDTTTCAHVRRCDGRGRACLAWVSRVVRIGPAHCGHRRRQSRAAPPSFTPGTAEANGQIVTAGGRVLTVVARGSGFADAIERAYRGVRAISFSGLQFRTDIGRKALQSQV